MSKSYKRRFMWLDKKNSKYSTWLKLPTIKQMPLKNWILSAKSLMPKSGKWSILLIKAGTSRKKWSLKKINCTFTKNNSKKPSPKSKNSRNPFQIPSLLKPQIFNQKQYKSDKNPSRNHQNSTGNLSNVVD